MLKHAIISAIFIAIATAAIAAIALGNATYEVRADYSPPRHELWVPPLVRKLIDCESGNDPNVIVQDDGGSPSYGLLQWKEESFWRYNLKYKVLPNLKRAEVRNVIMDEYAQTQLAVRVLEEPLGWKNWFNCLKRFH